MQYMPAIEKDFVVKLSDGKNIHGLQRGELAAGSRVVVLMHGLVGSPKSLLQYLGSRYLHERGYTTVSLYMYSYGDDYRDAKDCTIDTHIQDFAEVVTYLRSKNIKKLFAIGHSYGGLTILKTSVQLDGAVLWDPSHGLAWGKGSDIKRDWSEQSKSMLVSVDGPGSMRPIIAQHVNERMGDTSTLAKNIFYPTKIITGNKSVIYPFQQSYFDNLAGKKQLVAIKNAGHSFDESDETLEQLFSETVSWLDAI